MLPLFTESGWLSLQLWLWAGGSKMEAGPGRWSCHSDVVSDTVCSQGGKPHHTSSQEQVITFPVITDHVSGKRVHKPGLLWILLPVQVR